VQEAGGPDEKYRFVTNPFNSNEVIDMRHFLVVGPQGEMAGFAIELVQLLGGDRDSAFDAQDFLSNAMGRDFFDAYDPTQPFDYQLVKFFYGVIENPQKRK